LVQSHGGRHTLGRIRISAWTGSDPRWSPDSAKIAFLSYQGDQHGLWVVSLDKREPRFIAGVQNTNFFITYAGESLAWAPDSKRIAYISASEELTEPPDRFPSCFDHCMTPRYLLNQLDCSLRNLDLECVDIYYVHNPESQLGKITREEFDERLVKAFEALEQMVASGKIRMYGTATWNAYRNPAEAKDYLSLAQVVALAEKAGGKNHHFKVVQLPLNLGMSEALSSTNQSIGGKAMTLLEAAQVLDVAVMCSASVLQGQLTRNLPELIHDTFEGLQTDGQRALQFVRSTPGVATALVGMKQVAHVNENLQTARIAPASWEQYSKLFQSA